MSSFEHDEIKARIHHYLVSKTNFLEVKDNMQGDEMRAFVNTAIDNLCQDAKLIITKEERLAIVRELASSIVSVGPLRPFIEDPAVTEIMVNGHKSVYIQRAGKIEKTAVKFPDNTNLMHTIQKILAASGTSRRVDESSPYVDFSMADGSRVNVILPPCSLLGPILTVRKFSRELATIDDLIQHNTLNKQMAVFLTAAIKAKLNIVFCGSTGCGKTTMLNVLSSHIPGHERIITIEDTSELRLMQEHVVSLQAKPANMEGKGEVTIRDLFVNSLRMRPDRIIIGEVRGQEILDLVQSISSGHSGSLAIVHADSPQECFNRMVTMMLMSGIRLNGQEIQKQLATSVDLLVYLELYMDGVRRVANITDLWFDKATGTSTLNDIFTYKQEKIDEQGRVIGSWTQNKQKPSFYDKFVKRNVQLPQEFFQ
ncbi:MAG: CpaF family protein [Candidatus Omnitrophica bacterium]|nr:CpaF family protein [Candidatus Omnitrophota bacterium]MDE2009956.1 CpaF family protein [Candidatus Omnitrophota bacterium]MDE2213934.1 CpaF family protein [Candidatus Omnitrophota bacterium]MDE2231916.1 CpaF family protein [Candidatus Omnitrophota bacterium]